MASKKQLRQNYKLERRANSKPLNKYDDFGELIPDPNKCPDCGSNFRVKWSGVMCDNDDCDYWFCY